MSNVVTMTDNIIIFPGKDDNAIKVNNDILHFDFSKPKKILNIDINKISNIWWKNEGETKVALFTPDENGVLDHFFEETEENFNTIIKPFTDQYTAEKDRIEQEQEEYNTFENCQRRALNQLNTEFESAKESAHIISSLGFTTDANSVANENITGLLLTIGEDHPVSFCDYHNKFRDLNKSQLQILQTEIIINAQNLYNQKWAYRLSLEGANTIEELDNIVQNIKFEMVDFSKEAADAQS